MNTEEEKKKEKKKKIKLINKKAIYKTISWRIISILVSFGLSYYYLGSTEEATHYTVVYNGIGAVLYYLHELLYKKLRQKGKI